VSYQKIKVSSTQDANGNDDILLHLHIVLILRQRHYS